MLRVMDGDVLSALDEAIIRYKVFTRDAKIGKYFSGVYEISKLRNNAA